MKIGESKEDYLEAAYVLKRQKGYVRNSMLSDCLLYTSPSPRDRQKSRMPSSA